MTHDLPPLQRAAKTAATLFAYCAGAVLVALMAGTVADVLGRYLFNSPLLGVFDLTHFAVVIVVYLGMAYCTYHASHATIELLYNRLSAPLARFMDRLINIAAAVIMAILAWRAGVDGIQVKQFGQASQLLQIPLWPAYWVVVAGCALTALIFLMHAIWPERIEKDTHA